jgi:hypothetical protein
MNQREAVEVRRLLDLMDRAEPSFDEARSQRLFEQLMTRMAAQDQRRRRAWRVARLVGVAALVGAGAGMLQLLGL